MTSSTSHSQPWYDMASICFKLGVHGDISGKLDVIKMIKARDLLNKMIEKYYIDNPEPKRGGGRKKHGGYDDLAYIESPVTKTQIMGSASTIPHNPSPLNISTDQFNNVPNGAFTSGATIQSGISNLGDDLANTVLPPFTSQSGAGSKKVSSKNKSKK